MEEPNELEGLGGWLVLVGLGIIVSPIRIAIVTLPVYLEIVRNGSWALLTSRGSEVYHPLWAPILITEVGVNILIVGAWLFLAFLFFTKKKLFPKFYIALVVFSLIFILIDAFAIKIVMPNEPVFDPATIKELARGLISVCIWVPYMLLSKRVKATFVR